MRFHTIGIDEVGRGSLAGPVLVVAVSLRPGVYVRNRALGSLKDSKQLSAKQRERWFEYFMGHPGISYAAARISPAVIDRLNISRAANRAAYRAFVRLQDRGKIKPKNCKVYLDGGLYLGHRENIVKGISATTLIRGDELIPAISVASIIAKVLRDRYMTNLKAKYPAYGFPVHKGYGTLLHRKAILRHGASPVHRLTFLKKYPKLATNLSPNNLSSK